MRVTQQDIARISGVSQATVSRVLGGDDRVDGEIRDRVLAVMKSHNYQPDVRARNLRQRKTHLIGLVLKREQGTLKGDPFFAMLVSEIVDALAGTPWHLCVDIANDSSRQKHVYDDLLRTRRVDGLMMVEVEPSDNRILALKADNFPFVLIGNASEVPELNAIDNDNVFAGKIATQHLVENGYEKVAFLGGPANLTVTQDRVAGYSGIVDQPIIRYAEFGWQDARQVALQLLRGNNRPDAIVAMDDTMALGVVQAARELGLALGDDLGVVGFNDSSVCDLIFGGLTSVNLQIESMVRWAIRRLIQVIEDEPLTGPTQDTVGCQLVVRGSTKRRPTVGAR
ncbi:MAG: LacI family DNA-binding transcriptional regulator [Armatimonadetes bacterium]|nr:LacI family DNA-binding transcriptional regulator [Armatimonadota bacterium]